MGGIRWIAWPGAGGRASTFRRHIVFCFSILKTTSSIKIFTMHVWVLKQVCWLCNFVVAVVVSLKVSLYLDVDSWCCCCFLLSKLLPCNTEKRKLSSLSLKCRALTHSLLKITMTVSDVNWWRQPWILPTCNLQESSTVFCCASFSSYKSGLNCLGFFFVRYFLFSLQCK